ncbi:MAG: beta-ketoacyl synthase, partial [bacterium]|nr:beta-ketoacyl synthase [bacterium]
GMIAMDHMYHDHREDKERQGDQLQEMLMNVGPAWITQSYVGSYGPVINPVAACATALVSVSIGVDLIQQKKADFIVAGGYDDYSEEGAIGFQDMAATCSTDEMLERGISPAGMSRPNDSRRGGFVEAQGGGTLLLTRLDKAIEMGLPIYAIVALAETYSDGIHTSIPAPGLGLLGAARNGFEKSPLGQALQRFGLTADDITVVSKHDTSTAANDPNENKLHHLIQTTLKRDPGNPLLVHSQKSILGHAKGGAGAWQSIAAIQMMQTGLVPGNRNLEDVDPAMRAYPTLSFSDETLSLGKKSIAAVLMTSLGFGHVGSISLFIHPEKALSLLSAKEFEEYGKKRAPREFYHKQKSQRALMEKTAWFQKRKDRPKEEEEIRLLLEPK